ncbi:amylo-alpha-1,6-glucosidase [Chelativorans salis]|uniref:Amylo-alpha-1,6-glucosidase n=1 Tax=Chelativorans salis TaxID=2978478 RepID=A0ABT2LV77_9HYPH|nr:amylo-alpha-1,6-glucosidase [Chelativorans sp. EGI FJ00035]MCT7378414.1 amylo-alpha-1,6-glucosidase [Chelativorans sp. EGI FJ00035]
MEDHTDSLAPQPAEFGTVRTPQFFIAATAPLQERRPRTQKHGDTFSMFDHNGDALSGPGSPEGIFHRDTRHLSHLFLTINGERPLLLSSMLRDDNALLTFDLANPDLYEEGTLKLQHDLIHIRRTRFLWNGSCFERVSVRNYDEETQTVCIGLAFDADFADLFEVRGARRAKRGRMHAPKATADRVKLAYIGLDHVRRETNLRFDPTPTELAGDHAIYEIELKPRQTRQFFIEVTCGESPWEMTPRRQFFSGLREARRATRAAVGNAASMATSNDVFNEAVRRAVADLYMLVTETEDGPYPYAGIPWFSTVFGRDALITALQTLWLDPTIARGVLKHLAANQAREEDPAADAEPGKILHEVRYGEMAELGEVPFRCYYGSVDATPLFIMLAGSYLERTGDLETIRALWPGIEAALRWITDYGDRDGDGFVEYGRRTLEGLSNQGWKDSYDAVFHADGRLAVGPIAMAEVQAYVYAAWKAAARMADALSMRGRALELEVSAEELRTRFDRAFFDEELDTYVLALDGDKKPCCVRASNAGHTLFTGIAYPERAASVVRTLMGRPSFSGWGIRTVATTEARYNPMSYHNGSVWPHDNALIAAGFARYGFRGEAVRVFEGLFMASTYIDLRRLPELFCGFPRQRSRGPTFYPVACAPQAWAAVAPLSMLQSCLGMRFDSAGPALVFHRPMLPEFLEEVTLRGLALPGGSLDVALTRAGSEVVVQVLDRQGEARVTTTY